MPARRPGDYSPGCRSHWPYCSRCSSQSSCRARNGAIGSRLAASRAVFVLPRIKVQVSRPAKTCLTGKLHRRCQSRQLHRRCAAQRIPSCAVQFCDQGRNARHSARCISCCAARVPSSSNATMHSGSARDARQIVKAAQDGASLAFFPEGTFREEAGRRSLSARRICRRHPRRAASRTGRDQRHALRCCRPGGCCRGRNTLQIDILPAILPGGPDFRRQPRTCRGGSPAHSRCAGRTRPAGKHRCANNRQRLTE